MATDRYEAATRGEDLGLGTDEPEIHRFTRPTDRVSVEQKNAPGASDQERRRGLHQPPPGGLMSTNPTPHQRGYAAAQRELDNLAGFVDVDRRAEAASALQDVTFNVADADPVRAEFDAGYRQALNDAIAEADVIRCAACGSDQYAVEDLNIASGMCCTIVSTQLMLDVLAVVAPRTVGELITLADMVADAELGTLDVATVVTRRFDRFSGSTSSSLEEVE